MTGRVAACRGLAAGASTLGLAVILAVPLSLVLTVSIDAQVATGTIVGNVKDNSGSAVPGASVTATNVDTQVSRTTTSDAEGYYALPLMPVGRYKLEVTLSGFKNAEQTGILLEVGRSARVDATIEPGQLQEVVSVVANSPLVETNTAALSRTVGQNEVLNLPLVNRDLYSLLSITGGVSSNANSNSLGGPEQLTTINGSQNAQIGSVSFQLDGGNNTAGLRVPATRRRTRKRSRNFASSPTAIPPSTAAIRRASSTSSPSRGATSFAARSSSFSGTNR